MARILTLLALVGSLAACADAGPRLDVSSSVLDAPTGPGSGEPFLSTDGERVWMSWLERAPEGGHDLRFSHWDGQGWAEPRTVAHSERFFVNWADFPSITAAEDGSLWAHWLERGEAGGYDYGVRIASSDDGGATWSEPWTPHDDDSPTEHGFVSALPYEGGMRFAWLDGRRYAPGPDGSEPTSEMTLRARFVSHDGMIPDEELVDGRVCDCCQTAMALSASGPVVAYRDRTEDEIRDIYVARLEDGVWQEGIAVHDDGWHIDACPVNGPAVEAAGDRVAVAWFTGAGDVALVKVAFSEDGARSFGAPTVVSDGAPAGRVDLQLLGDGSALVSWLERTEGGGAEVRLRRVSPDGAASEAVTVTSSSAERASGFPRMVVAPDGAVIMAWTDTSGEDPRVRTQRLEVEGS